MYLHIYMCMYMCIYMYIFVYIYIHVYMYKHVYMFHYQLRPFCSSSLLSFAICCSMLQCSAMWCSVYCVEVSCIASINMWSSLMHRVAVRCSVLLCGRSSSITSSCRRFTCSNSSSRFVFASTMRSCVAVRCMNCSVLQCVAGVCGTICFCVTNALLHSYVRRKCVCTRVCERESLLDQEFEKRTARQHTSKNQKPAP